MKRILCYDKSSGIEKNLTQHLLNLHKIHRKNGLIIKYRYLTKSVSSVPKSYFLSRRQLTLITFCSINDRIIELYRHGTIIGYNHLII